MAQLIRQGKGDAAELQPFLNDTDEEIIAQAARMIGDVKHAGAAEALIGLLGHPSPRVRFFTMEALGRTGEKRAVQPIMTMLRRDGGKDTWLRHGGMIALGRIGDVDAMASIASDGDRNMKAIAVVALRRMEAPEVGAFLKDEDEYIAAEAARAINDDTTIPGALPALANVLNRPGLISEPLLRRAINANLTLGKDENVDLLIAYARNVNAPAELRAEALATLANWGTPSVYDRVDGRYRGPRSNPTDYVSRRVEEFVPELLAKGDPAVRQSAIQAVAALEITSASDQLVGLLRSDGNPALRAEAVVSLDRLKVPGLERILRVALADQDDGVRQRALEILPASNVEPAAAVKLYRDIISKGTTGEGQAAIAGLGKLKGPEAQTFTEELLDRLAGGELAAPLHLDLITIAENSSETGITEKLAAYEKALTEEDDLGLMASALAGGNPSKGRDIFYWNSTAQCTRCHAVFEYGGNVGPNLANVGTRLGARELLTSVIRPSAALAAGHETVLVTLANEEMISGIVQERTPEYLKLKIGKTDTKTIPLMDIMEEETLPSSMPTVEGKISRREIRDLVAYLGTLRGHEEEI